MVLIRELLPYVLCTHPPHHIAVPQDCLPSTTNLIMNVTLPLTPPHPTSPPHPAPPRSIRLVLSDAVAPGSPVAAWCGPQPNSRLLLNYGIVDEHNPYDKLQVRRGKGGREGGGGKGGGGRGGGGKGKCVCVCRCVL